MMTAHDQKVRRGICPARILVPGSGWKVCEGRWCWLLGWLLPRPTHHASVRGNIEVRWPHNPPDNLEANR